MPRRLSLGAKWTLLYTTAMLLTLSIFCGYLYTRVERRLQRDARLVLDLELADLQTFVAGLPEEATDWQALVQQHVERADPELRLGVRLLDPDGAERSSAGSLAGHTPPLPERVRLGAKGRIVRDVDLGRDDPFLLASAATPRGYVQAAIYTRRFARSTAHIRNVIVAALAPLLLLTAALGWWLSRGSLRPIAAMTRTARRISSTHLEEEVPRSGSGDELDELAATLNAMIARIRDGMSRVRRFSADAAHELRTPLAALRSQIEVTLARERTTAEHRHVLREILEQVERLGETVQGMLRLAESEGGIDARHRERVELAPLLDEVTAFFAALAEERGIELKVGAVPPAALDGDPTWLRQLFGNLLENAVRHTPVGGRVEIEATAEREQVAVHVQDTGPGIPEADRARIFESFGRGAAAPGRSGAGLGLALAREIARAHGGSVELTSSAPTGSRFTVRLPLAP